MLLFNSCFWQTLTNSVGVSWGATVTLGFLVLICVHLTPVFLWCVHDYIQMTVHKLTVHICVYTRANCLLSYFMKQTNHLKTVALQPSRNFLLPFFILSWDIILLPSFLLLCLLWREGKISLLSQDTTDGWKSIHEFKQTPVSGLESIQYTEVFGPVCMYIMETFYVKNCSISMCIYVCICTCIIMRTRFERVYLHVYHSLVNWEYSVQISYTFKPCIIKCRVVFSTL